MVQIIDNGLSFDDVLLVPQYSKVNSRSSVDTSVIMYKGNEKFRYSHPLIPANMKTVSGIELALEVAKSGGLALLHRFEDYNIIATEWLNKAMQYIKNIAFSVGVQEKDYNFVNNLCDNGARIICVDVAHGHSQISIDMIEYIANRHPNVLLIAGNVATKEGAIALWEAGADVIKVNIGAGCFGADTRILMSNGTYKNIVDVEEGDYVINKEGSPVRVKAKVCTGVKKVLKIRNSISGTHTYATTDHKFWIGDLSTSDSATYHGYVKILEKSTRLGESKYKWKEIGNINKREIGFDAALLVPNKINFDLTKDFSIDINKRFKGNGHDYNEDDYKLIFNMTPSYDLGYMFGTFLGDGCATVAMSKTKIGAVHWYFGLHEENIVNKLSKVVKNIFNYDLKIKTNKSIITCTMYNKPLAEYLFTFGKKNKKHLPSNLIVDNKEYLQGLYDGLIDSDGNVEKNGRVNFTNTSLQLIELFNVISFILNGTFPNVQQKKKTAGRLNIKNIEKLSTPYISRKNTTANKRLTKEYQVVKILEISDENLEIPVYDIEVECPTHSFIANNVIVHNSLCSTRVESGNGVPQLSALIYAHEAREEFIKKHPNRKVYIIADGGMKCAGDVVKSLCFSDMAMSGSFFSGCQEAPGEIVQMNGISYKKYAGSSTHKNKHIEGVTALVPLKGKVNDIINKILEGVRSGCSYQGVDNLTDLRDNPVFIKMTVAGYNESVPHNPFTIKE